MHLNPEDASVSIINMFPKWTPKWTQNGPKMDPKWTQNWTQNGPKMDPKCVMKNATRWHTYKRTKGLTHVLAKFNLRGIFRTPIFELFKDSLVVLLFLHSFFLWYNFSSLFLFFGHASPLLDQSQDFSIFVQEFLILFCCCRIGHVCFFVVVLELRSRCRWNGTRDTFTAFLSIITPTECRRPPVLTSMLKLSWNTPLVCHCAAAFHASAFNLLCYNFNKRLSVSAAAAAFSLTP